MATLAELKVICQYAGWVSTRSGSDAALTQFINDTLETLVSLAEWPEYFKRDGSQAIVSGTDEYTLSDGELGSELVTNGDFDDASDWDTNGSVAISGGEAVFTGTGQLTQAISLVAGHRYQATFRVSNYVSGSVDLDVGGTDGTNRTANGTYTETIIAGSDSDIHIQGFNTPSLRVDDVSVKEIVANIDSLGIVSRSGTTLPLEEIPVAEWLDKKTSLAATGLPSEYAVEKGVSSGSTVVKLLLYPEPTSSETLYYSYKRKPVTMTTANSVADWPDTRIWLLANALEYIMAQP